MTWTEQLRLNWIVTLLGKRVRPELFAGRDGEWFLSFEMADGMELTITVPRRLWAETLRRTSMDGALDPFDGAVRHACNRRRRSLMKVAQWRLGREVTRESIAHMARRRTVLRRSP